MGALIRIEDARRERPADVGEAILENLDGLYRFALRLTRNPYDAQELAQETVSRAWERKQAISINPRAWLFQTLYHTFVSRHRQQRRWGGTRVDFEGESAKPEQFADPLPAIIAHEDVRRAIEVLPEELSAVVWLSDAEGFSLREIAQALGWPIGTVASRLWRARQELRLILSAYRPQGEKQS